MAWGPKEGRVRQTLRRKDELCRRREQHTSKPQGLKYWAVRILGFSLRCYIKTWTHFLANPNILIAWYIGEFIILSTRVKDKLWAESEVRLGDKGETEAMSKSLTASVALVGNSHSSCTSESQVFTHLCLQKCLQNIKSTSVPHPRARNSGHQDYDVYRFWKLLTRFQFTFRIENCADCILQSVGKHREDLCKRQLDILEWCLSEDEK